MKKRHDRGVDATGKSRADARHIRLYARMLDSTAYLATSCGGRALLIELTKLHNGSNNGRIALGVRQAGERLGVSKTRVVGYFDELIGKGFIKLKGRGAFNSKGRYASEWTLTDCPTMGQPATLPTRDYLAWTGADFETPPRPPRKPTLGKLLSAKKQNLGPSRVDTASPTCGRTVPHVWTQPAEVSLTCGRKRPDSPRDCPSRVDTHNNQAQGDGAGHAASNDAPSTKDIYSPSLSSRGPLPPEAARSAIVKHKLPPSPSGLTAAAANGECPQKLARASKSNRRSTS